MRLLTSLLVIILSFVPVKAEALTLRDIVELSRAGLSDDVLVALIDVHKGVFSLDMETLKSLKADGVSDRVLVAIINSGRTPPPAPVPAVEELEPAPAPPVVVIEHYHTASSAQVVVQQVPVYVPVPVERPSSRRVSVDRAPTPPSPFYTGQVSEPAPHEAAAPAPVYWGFGGKLRPDAWDNPPPPRTGGRKDRDESTEGRRK
jgi:hypothetical protein